MFTQARKDWFVQYNKQNYDPLIFADFVLHLRSSEQLATFNPCKIRDKIDVPTNLILVVRSIHKKGCKWNPLTISNMFKDLSLESRNMKIPKRLSSAQFGLLMGRAQKRKIARLTKIQFCFLE